MQGIYVARKILQFSDWKAAANLRSDACPKEGYLKERLDHFSKKKLVKQVHLNKQRERFSTVVALYHAAQLCFQVC